MILVRLKIIPILLFLVAVTTLKAQDCNFDSLYFTSKVKNDTIRNYLILNKDLSSIFYPDTYFYGFIGQEMQKINIHYSKAEKITNDTYIISGYTLLKQSKCSFKGELKILKIAEFKNYYYGLDSLYKDSSIVYQGKIYGEYLFKEDVANCSYAGIFKGYFVSDILIMNDAVKKNTLNSYSDSYSNNQYCGVWTSIKSGKSKVCNWGENRIPCSKDLDVGVSEFFPNGKYRNSLLGW